MEFGVTKISERSSTIKEDSIMKHRYARLLMQWLINELGTSFEWSYEFEGTVVTVRRDAVEEQVAA